MKSKTKISKQLKKKSNSVLAETILAGKKQEAWVQIVGMLSGPRRKRICLNLDEIDANSKEGENVLIPGKVLSQGKVNKKLKVIALDFSEKAKEKLLSEKCQVTYIIDEIKSNASAKGIKILK
ncbi:MAG: 50S ribosomal protein L18e [Candidatus Diapherotrites archaeon ADurb.Bin253]|jgi:large subunit ribosomal protein L18e|nr:uL15 family ribosomal protein [Candidatus Pacearchaeota archaeon]OQA69085.1 MAG: 50S ribosomal protein L18e [Candidatus Diapherotrites archaeon ADurb.Bin253]HNZ52154.1 uL15 family ribosomal protein [Candidatus Pacearchaeota archaeon]HOC97169.1 uL15 family ribosomal protein [Candidatus Pacearchaeota archaeon]HOF44156.1 uL15 family ribosomal protein [Candidatus Pacearchaeota archaeon]